VSTSPARAISPFPVVRLRGRLTRGGVRVSLLTVSGPRGIRVAVRCIGGGCPRASVVRRVPLHGPRLVVVPGLRRVLRAGARLEVRMTQDGMVGKYTRFLIRRGAEPLRLDRCLAPGSATPQRC
jgi:uncharacterized protein YwbE